MNLKRESYAEKKGERREGLTLNKKLDESANGPLASEAGPN